ncbi:helix-turn-helix domain-containing protein, partial [Liquorilactobacillus nagelii]
MKTGELIRSIRTSKGIKAKTIYDGLLSRSMYYKYESGLVETTADTFLHILDRLNVDSTEFIALFEKQNNERTHYEEYRENLMTAFKQKNLNEVRLLEKKIERDYQSNQLVRFYNLKLVALAMKKHFGHHESILPERREVVHYLSRSKYWSHYEYELLADSIFMFDGSSLDKLLSDHEWFNNDDAQDIRMENLKVKVLCEAILLFIKTRRETQA